MKQISVFLENKPGSLNEMLKVLADNDINIDALSLTEAEGFGIVRLIVNNDYKATTVLKEASFVHNIVEVAVVEIPNEAGGLLKVLNVLKDKGINLDYMYAFTEGSNACFALKVGDTKACESALRGAGMKVLSDED